MPRNLHIPQAGDDLSAAWARQIVEEIRKHRLNVMPPLALSRTPCGTTLRMISQPEGIAGTPSAPWDISFSDAEATFTNCCLKRATVTRFFSDQTHTMPDVAEAYVGFRYNMSSGEIEIISGTASTDVSDATADGSADWDKTVLYRCKRPTGGAWRVVADYRNMPGALLYL